MCRGENPTDNRIVGERRVRCAEEDPRRDRYLEGRYRCEDRDLPPKGPDLRGGRTFVRRTCWRWSERPRPSAHAQRESLVGTRQHCSASPVFSIQLITSSWLMSTDTDGGSLHPRLRVGVGSNRRAAHPCPLDDTDSRRLFLASCPALHLAFSTEWIVVTPRHDQPARGRPHHPVSFPIHPFGFPFKPFLSLLSKRLETWTVDETPLGTVLDESTTGSCFGKARRRSRHTCIFAP